MRNDDHAGAKRIAVTPTARQMVSELARHSGAGLNFPKKSPGAMCEQGQDWSRGNACVPQKFVRLVGHRDPDARPTTPLPQRPMRTSKKTLPSDTPIG